MSQSKPFYGNILIPSSPSFSVTVNNSGPAAQIRGVFFSGYPVTHMRGLLTAKERCTCLRAMKMFRETSIAVRDLLPVCNDIHDCDYHNHAMQMFIADYALRWLETNPCYAIWSLEDPDGIQNVRKWLLHVIPMGRPF